ncbi:MAG: hypothetical protein QXI01_00010 [Nitrososphaerota archaeon]
MDVRTIYILILLIIGLILLSCAMLYEHFMLGAIGFAFIISAILIWNLTKGHHAVRR